MTHETKTGDTKFGISLPQVYRDDSLSGPELGSFASAMEDLGFATLWTSELLQARLLDPLALLNYVAGFTSRIRLGVAVILLPFRVPAQLARELATLDQLSGGRLILGVGLGSDRKLHLYDQYGLSRARRVGRFTTAIELLRQLWRHDEVTHKSDWWDIESLKTMVPTVQKPNPPIWIGSHAGPALRRAAEIADGWIGAGGDSLDSFLVDLEKVRSHLTELGRDPASFAVSKRVFIHVADDREQSMGDLRSWFQRNQYGRSEMVDKVVVFGDASHCISELSRLTSAGVDEVILNPVHDERRQAEVLASEVLPGLRTKA
jgi:alkanesulfonate monooxygenase SsuD/methylene tetrahydromethanopterin reductase-like flavin-dependent oxidoreductase (luciferase family)